MEKVLIIFDKINLIKERFEDMQDIARIFYYSFRTYILSTYTFGKGNKVTKEVIHLFLEYYHFYQFKQRVLSYINKRMTLEKVADGIEGNMAPLTKYLDDIIDYQDDLYLYFIDSIDQIETAIDLKLEYKAALDKIPKRPNDISLEALFSAALSTKDIAKYFGVTGKSYKELENFIIELVPIDDNEMSFLGIMYKLSQEQKLKDIRICIPEIIDEKTLESNIFELFLGCKLFSLINQQTSENDITSIAPLTKDELESIKKDLFEKEKALLFK